MIPVSWDKTACLLVNCDYKGKGKVHTRTEHEDADEE